MLCRTAELKDEAPKPRPNRSAPNTPLKGKGGAAAAASSSSSSSDQGGSTAWSAGPVGGVVSAAPPAGASVTVEEQPPAVLSLKQREAAATPLPISPPREVQAQAADEQASEEKPEPTAVPPRATVPDVVKEIDELYLATMGVDPQLQVGRWVGKTQRQDGPLA